MRVRVSRVGDQRAHLVWLLAGALIGLWTCCVESDRSGMPDYRAPPVSALRVWNRSQFELLEVRVHDAAGYASAKSLLSDGSLAIDAMLTIMPFEENSFVTVLRRRVELGEVIAVTTGSRIYVGGKAVVLEVFDDSFRLTPSTSITQCTDGASGNMETDVDCGGLCARCSDGRLCGGAADCKSLVCVDGTCAEATCDDGVLNGDEHGIDRGGTTCSRSEISLLSQWKQANQCRWQPLLGHRGIRDETAF